MDNPRLLVLNTIGLTGVEVLLSELARVPGILALPGQNFSMFGHNLYRPHDYSKHSAEAVFRSLNRTLYTKDGRIWMGLTKHMSPEQRAAYPAAKHQELFVARLGTSRDFVHALRAYILSFFEVIGLETRSAAYVTFYANNIALNSRHYPGLAENVTIVNLFCRPARWLAMISQTRTWNCAEACKFWILNNLYLRQFAGTHPRYHASCYDDLVDNPEVEIAKITNFLGLHENGGKNDLSAIPGMVSINPRLLEMQKENDVSLRAIYQDYGLFQMAERFDEWAPEFLRSKRIGELLAKYARFWNSTSHTNFDWIGPVGEEIVEEAARFFPQVSGRNLSFDFYHRYFTLNSDNFDRPVVALEHFLGCLEEEIVIPKLPYFLRVAMEYLISISRNNLKLRHSYVSVRDASIYRRLTQPDYQTKIAEFGLTQRMREVEEKITGAEMACTQAN
jgi:hypothetical protein